MPQKTVFEIEEEQSRMRAAEELARLRHLNVKPDEAVVIRTGLPCRRELYDLGFQTPSNGWRPDPNRRVSASWPTTSTDGRVLHFKDDTEKGGLKYVDKPVDAKKKFRVRYLRGPRAGAVMDVPLQEFIGLRSHSVGSNWNSPVAEPVPADEKLCPPARPSNMPSHFGKACSRAARALKKEVEDLSFEEVATYYRGFQNGRNGK